MILPAPAAAVVRSYFRALLTGDRDLLASVALPHPELACLVPTRPPIASVATLLADLARLPLASTPLPGERHLVRASVGGVVQVLLLRDTASGPRVDVRYAIGATRPDDDRRQAARSFYRALLLGDETVLRDLAFDERGIERLAERTPPAGERAQLEHAAEALGLAELAIGEPFAVPDGVQFVNARHAELGITVMSGLSAAGEIPFLLRQRDHRWRVITFWFLQAATDTRAASTAS